MEVFVQKGLQKKKILRKFLWFVKSGLDYKRLLRQTKKNRKRVRTMEKFKKSVIRKIGVQQYKNQVSTKLQHFSNLSEKQTLKVQVYGPLHEYLLSDFIVAPVIIEGFHLLLVSCTLLVIGMVDHIQFPFCCFIVVFEVIHF